LSSLEPNTDRVALTRELTEFLVELSVALHKHSMYPSEHPALEPAIQSIVRRAETLLAERPMLAFGVARRQLIIEGQTTDPNHPVLRRLAETLHRHHLGAISLLRGVEAAEIGEALRALSADAERDGPVGLRPAAQREWPHFRLHPLTFDRLSLVGDQRGAAGGSGGGGSGSARAAELWVGLARAAIASGEGDSTPVSTDPSDVARAIEEHDRPAAYDQVIVGHLLQIAGELRTAPPGEVEALRRRTSVLISALKPATLRRLVDMGGNSAQRGSFVLDATHGMDVEAVLQIIRAAADANGRVISNGMVRLMSKLASQAGSTNDVVRPIADAELRAQVTQLLAGWELEDPNPERYSRVLEHLATETADREAPTLRDAADTDTSQTLRTIEIALEVGVTGPTVQRAVDRIVQSGQVGGVLELLKARPPGSDGVADALVAQLVRPASLAALVNREPMDEASLDGLLPFMSAEGFQALLDVLASSENRATRRKLIDRLARAALDTGPYIAARLEDERWYVLRNMLLLMERSGHIPEGFSATRWTAHQDARVRYEALRLQLTIARERDRAIRTALQDDDPRIVRLGLAALQQDCPPAYAPLVAAMAANPQGDSEVRLLAVNALARLSTHDSLETLLKVVDGGRTFFGRPKLAAKTPVVLSALRALAQGWAADPRAAVFLKRGAQSADADVRQAAQRAQS
jgi:hypothetical protein